MGSKFTKILGLQPKTICGPPSGPLGGDFLFCLGLFENIRRMLVRDQKLHRGSILTKKEILTPNKSKVFVWKINQHQYMKKSVLLWGMMILIILNQELSCSGHEHHGATLDHPQAE